MIETKRIGWMWGGLIVLLLGLSGCDDGGKQSPTNSIVPAQSVVQRDVWQEAARQDLAQEGRSQILFGDLHVHTTYSPDAFITAMPLQGGDGLHPPADACDFARFCSALDFWSINDHAEGITPARWQATRESIRQCNAVSGTGLNPDTVAFLGWEWTQVSTDPQSHYGHKNVIFLDTEEGKVPTRSIAAPRRLLGTSPVPRSLQLMLGVTDFANRDYYFNIDRYYQEIADTPICEKGVNTRDLPTDCLEVADDPQELFTKLGEWGFEHIVIPHGNSWGLNTPPGTTLDKQLNASQHDPINQTLFEVYSGHGSSEAYRSWRAVERKADGSLTCPIPRDNYTPCCWRAGEIIRERCSASGEAAEECETRANEARQNFVDAGVSGHLTVPGQQVEDWLNCGQCEDCFNPPMDHRPATSAQYALAISNFDQPGDPLRFRFGLIASSDNHRARAGSGYKEFDRRVMTETNGALAPSRFRPPPGDQREPIASSVRFDPGDPSFNLNNLRNMERQASFFMTGGLVAVHSAGRDRQSIWDSLKRKEVYGTSGDRLLLWFDYLENGQKSAGMGAEVITEQAPVFRVTAAGAFKQLPGCPGYASGALGEDRLQRLCRGECYNPSDERKKISRIEVVRITPQIEPGEEVAQLIDDPWRSFPCEPSAAGCQVEFSDPEFEGLGREAIYYARVIQEPSPAVNGGQLRCEYDADGRCIKVTPCYGDYRTEPGDDCLAPNEERAWSSPIFVRPAASMPPQ